MSDELPSTTQTIGRERTQTALQSAIALIRRGLCPDAAGIAIDEGEQSGYERRLLKSHCTSTGLIVPASILPKPGGAEHDVFFDGVSRRWLKFTKPQGAGYTVDVDGESLMMLPATPLQYLMRWLISNRIFGDDAELAGIWENTQGGSRIVISQRDISGEDSTWEEIEEHFVRQKGFRRIEPPRLDSCGGYQSRAYWRGRYAVFDVRPSNCIRTSSGEIMSIDVIPIVCSLAGASYLSRFVVS